jgi:NAD(P)-dependent dehydrogenase (short-subunit alcohol dehydrogenase family)
MKEQKSGSIVNVASKAGMSGASSGIAYTASKHGLVSIVFLLFNSLYPRYSEDRSKLTRR